MQNTLLVPCKTHCLLQKQQQQQQQQQKTTPTASALFAYDGSKTTRFVCTVVTRYRSLFETRQSCCAAAAVVDVVVVDATWMKQDKVY